MNDRLMSTGNVAEVLDISEATVKRWADAGTLPCIRTPGGHRKFRLRDIAMHLASRRNTSSENTSPAPGENDCSVDDVVSALLVGDTDKILRNIATLRLHRVSIAAIVDTVLQPAFVHVGNACGTGGCEPFHQHIANNSLIEATVLQKSNARGARRARGHIVAAPLPVERTDIPARFAALVAAESGFEAQVLGPGLEPQSIARAADDLGATWIVLVGDIHENDGSLEFAKSVLMAVSRSQARVICIGLGRRPIPDNLEDILVVPDFREAEGLLSPASHRGGRLD